MKMRFGFVSNSSSSSFVIAMPKGEEVNFGTVAKALFPDNENLRGGFGNGYNEGVSTPEAVSLVLEQMLENGIADDDNLGQTVHSLSYGERPDFLNELAEEEPDYDTIVYGSKNWTSQNRNQTDEERREAWQRYDDANNAWREKVVAAMKAYADKNNVVWYVLEYGDDSSIGSTMEHGGVFNNMVHRGYAMRISNH
jgi:hypothetical protein